MFERLRKLLSTVWIKITVLFIILLLPLIMLGITIYFHGYDTIKKEISNSSSAQLALYAKSLEDEISRIQLMEYQLASDEDLNYLANAYSVMSDFERSQYMLRAVKMLTIMKNSSSFIESAVIHIPSIQKTVSTDSSSQFFFESYADSLKKHQEDSGLSFENNQICLYAQYPFTLASANEYDALFIIKVTLSNSAITDMLNGFNQYPGSYTELSAADQDYTVWAGSALPEAHEQQVITSTSIRHTALSLESRVPTDQIYGKIRNYKSFFIMYMILSIAVILLFSSLIQYMIHRPIRHLMRVISNVEAGDFHVEEISYSRNDEFHYLYKAFNNMTRSLEDLIHQVYEQKILTQKAELRQLQSQINPHFLYNSFFNIYRLAKDEDCENIAVFSQYLGKYYQYITRNAADQVPLADEYNHACTYCQIQTMRFHNRLKTEMMPLPPAVSQIMVPRIIIQPIIENAFEHGLKTVEAPHLKIQITAQADSVTISVEDNGPKLPAENFLELVKNLESSDLSLETTAILNIHRRLRMRFGDRAGITLAYGELGGLLAEIHIPIERGEENPCIDC